MANLMSDIPSKEAMLRIAEDYERHAKRAEERAKRSPAGEFLAEFPLRFTPSPESAWGSIGATMPVCRSPA
jgi:hypothetical protein